MKFPVAVPEIPVSHIDKAAAYYETKLGFKLDWGREELGLAGISKRNCRIFLASPDYRKQYGMAMWPSCCVLLLMGYLRDSRLTRRGHVAQPGATADGFASRARRNASVSQQRFQ